MADEEQKAEEELVRIHEEAMRKLKQKMAEEHYGIEPDRPKES